MQVAVCGIIDIEPQCSSPAEIPQKHSGMQIVTTRGTKPRVYLYLSFLIKSYLTTSSKRGKLIFLYRLCYADFLLIDNFTL